MRIYILEGLTFKSLNSGQYCRYNIVYKQTGKVFHAGHIPLRKHE